MTKRRAAAATISSQPEKGQECCMCGDFGLSSQLFRCKVCQFRSQHRYCSNEYPKAEDYSVCNWCLISGIKDEESRDKTHINSSLSNGGTNSRNTSSGNEEGEEEEEEGERMKEKKKKKKGATTAATTTTIKKQIIETLRPHPERLPLLSAARKRITTTRATRRSDDDHHDAIEEKLRRTKSEEISKDRKNTNKKNAGMMKKPVFRSKVRRYKLLDEVSTL